MQYISDLDMYLEDQGACFIDFTDNQTITGDLFYTVDHLSEEGMEILTNLFSEELAQIIGTPDKGKPH